MWYILILVLTVSISQAKWDGDPEKIVSECEKILTSTDLATKISGDDIFRYLRVLDGHIQTIEQAGVLRSADLRKEITSIYQNFCEDFCSPSLGLKNQVHNLAQKVSCLVNSLNPDDSTAGSACKSLRVLDLIDRPTTLVANLIYDNDNSIIKTVEFHASVIKDLATHQVTFVSRVFRAISKGFVRGDNASGIKRLGSIHPRLIELKLHPSPFRIFGCMDGSHIRFKRVVHKSHQPFAYGPYEDLCK